MDDGTAAVMAETCALYGLGRTAGTPERVSGGLQHALYHVRATEGEFAVKSLNLRLPNARENCERGEHIAWAAKAAGLPAVGARKGPGGFTQGIGEAVVMVFPWYSGVTLPPTAAAPAQTGQIGALLGRLHALNLHVASLDPPAPQWFPEAHWDTLVRAGEREDAPWAEALSGGFSQLQDWNEATREAENSLAGTWVTTHRDLDQKNVLWSGADMPWLLDWEAAGPMAPALEVMGAALNWAGQSAGAPERETFAAFIAGYRSAAALDQDRLRHAAVAVLGKWLIWLEINLRRSLAAGQAPPEERTLARGAAAHAFATLRRLAAETPMRLVWCDGT